jgi:hypothetical protein
LCKNSMIDWFSAFHKPASRETFPSYFQVFVSENLTTYIKHCKTTT